MKQLDVIFVILPGELLEVAFVAELPPFALYSLVYFLEWEIGFFGFQGGSTFKRELTESAQRVAWPLESLQKLVELSLEVGALVGRSFLEILEHLRFR